MVTRYPDESRVFSPNQQNMAQIPVSINRTGDITISDITVAAGETVTWWVNGGTVTSITPGDPHHSVKPNPGSNGAWDGRGYLLGNLHNY